MSEAENRAAVEQIEKTSLETARAKAVMNRRYVGTKETAAYIMYDIAQSFNINKYGDIFITDIVKIGLKFQSIVSFIVGLWDIVNDLFLAAIVDKTRTRWGKFKPWLIIYAIPGVMLSIFYWTMPITIGSRAMYDIGKLSIYLIFSLVQNLAGSMSAIARTGSLATITPNIIDRTRLITEANLLSGFVEKAPEIIMGLLIDLVNHGKLKIKMTSLYVSAGVFCSVVSGLFAIYFAFVSKERVNQTIEKPSVKASFRSIATNKPLLLITLSEFLGAFSIGSGVNYYYINVLGLATMSTIVGIPGAIVSPISYSYVTWARKKFSTKTLWIFGSHISDFLMIGVFLIGSINKNYKKLSVMIPAFMLRETIWMFFWGIRSVIPEEMRNESIDYGEWKNGYRNEGLTGVAKELPRKLINTFGATVKTLILDRVGYVEGAGFGGQTEKTEYSLFWMCTILPVITGILSIIPKCFYNLTGEKRDQMYRELHERRKLREEQYDAKLGETEETPAAVQ